MTSEESDGNATSNSTTNESAVSATGKDEAAPCNVPRLRLAIGPISPEALAACARVLARFAVEQAQIELATDKPIDKGSDQWRSDSDEPTPTQINGPVSAINTDGAKELVI